MVRMRTTFRGSSGCFSSSRITFSSDFLCLLRDEQYHRKSRKRQESSVGDIFFLCFIPVDFFVHMVFLINDTRILWSEMAVLRTV